jgi:hypothetical protein
MFLLEMASITFPLRELQNPVTVAHSGARKPNLAATEIMQIEKGKRRKVYLVSKTETVRRRRFAAVA